MGARREMLPTGEVASRLGVTINTVKAWIRAGRIDAVRLPSGHYRVPSRELSRLLSSRRGYRAARAGWADYEAWRSDRSALPDLPLADVLAWANGMLELSREQGPIGELSPDDKAQRIARMKNALGVIRA